METVSRIHASNLVAFAKDKPAVLVLSADLTSSCEADLFRDTFPDRFYTMGMAEQNMMGFAGGLAREGFEPYLHTFAVFLTRRVFDQVAMSVAYPNLPVRMVGFLPGLTTPGGVTHQAIDDVALMRVLPNMTILESGDATDVESVLDVAHAIPGPVYIRQLRGLLPRLFPKNEPMAFNHARILSQGDDVALLTSGITTQYAMEAVTRLQAGGVSVSHLHVSTLKPFTDPQVLEVLKSARHGVVTVENHSIIGGLGSAVAEVMAENGVGTRLRRLGIQDVYAHGASREYLLAEYGLDTSAIEGAVFELLGRGEELERRSDSKVRAVVEDKNRVEDL